MKTGEKRQYREQLASERRKYQEMDGANHTLDLLLDAAQHHRDPGYLAYLTAEFGIDYDEGGKTALFWVAGSNDLTAARALLDAGASVQATRPGLASPLMHAAFRGQEAMARLLVSRGAIVAYFDTNGDSALSFARERGHHVLAAYLETLLVAP